MKHLQRLCQFELLGSRRTLFFVIPAKAGIQFFNWLQSFWTPVFTGVTTFYETILIILKKIRIWVKYLEVEKFT